MTNFTDPWHMQRTLMEASAQTLPVTPELNKGGLLYAALTMEELSETMFVLAAALQKAEPAALGTPLARIRDIFQQAATQLHHHSLNARDILGSAINDNFRITLEEADVVELADGTTDVAVTNSGFALSLGLDGAACYAEVAGSNLSKRNPDTGRIDKTADGKWIKGIAFEKPNLRKTIFGE